MIRKIQANQRFTIVASFLIVGAMMVCLAVSFVQLGELILPGWSGDYLVALSFLVAIEAMYSHRRLAHLSFTEKEFVVYRLAEFILIFFVLKLAFYLVNGFDLLLLDLPLWREDLWMNFFTGEYLFGITVVLIIWVVSLRFSADLQAFEVDEQELRAEIESGVFEQRPAVRERMGNLILGIGMLMTFLATALRLDMMRDWLDLPEMRAGVANLLAYFLLSLVLLSLTEYNLLRVSWMVEKVPVRKEIPRRWLFYSSVFILGIAVLAFVLPTNYSIGFLAVLKYLLFGMWAVATLLMSILFTPIFLLINFLLSLLGSKDNSVAMPDLSRFEPRPPAVAEPAPIPWLELLKSLLFWVVFLAVIGFSLYYYLREHADLLIAMRKFPLLSGLVRFWEWLRQWVGAANRQFTNAVDGTWQRLKARLSRRPLEQSWNFINLHSISPRERIIFYYLALVRRGGETAIQRKPSQTPYEYSRALTEALLKPADEQSPEEHAPSITDTSSLKIEQEVTAITECFVESRYSLHEVTDQDASLVRRYWERIRRFLRDRRR
jgi:hypothetical protein